MSQNQQIKMTIWFVACLIASGALSLPSSAVELANQGSSLNGTQQNVTSTSLMTKQSPVSQESMNNSTTRTRRALASGVESVSVPANILLSSAPSRSSSVASSMMGDSVGLETALRANGDLTPAAGEHKKYVLVKKKPKHKKIKMEVYKPKMKYKKIKIKVPVKKMKKKKVKGYLVKKEKHHHHY